MLDFRDRIGSTDIATAAEIAAAAGNALMHVSEGWSKVRRVVFMSGQLTPSVREAILSAVPDLTYWSVPGTPHDPSTEGFLSQRDAVAISFPRVEGAPRVR